MSKKLVFLAVCTFVVGFIGMGCQLTDSSSDSDVVEIDSAEDGQMQAAEIIRYNGNQGEPVVMVHGNTGYPSDFDRSVSYFTSHGWPSSKIFRPSWGSKTCAACNDHCGSEIDTVKSALQSAMNASTTGKIDVMGHSMGATLAAKAILDKGWGSSQVRTFVGIAGAFRGLNSCTYATTTTCGSCGLRYNSNVMNQLANKRWSQKQYAIYSWVDEIVCNCGAGYNVTCCYIYGVHTSRPQVLDASTSYSTYPYGHWGTLYYSEARQADYCDNY
jgi:uncharacterized alpha/beta hydrolase family protein